MNKNLAIYNELSAAAAHVFSGASTPQSDLTPCLSLPILATIKKRQKHTAFYISLYF